MNFGKSQKICSTMKSFSVFFIFILAAFLAVAQTDTNAIVVPAETNAPAAPSATNGVAVQTDTNAIVVPVETNAPAPPSGTNAAAGPAGLNTAPRAMSLEDCLQEALQHNLDVQIERYAPQISLYTLRGAYAGYDPLLNISGQHNRDVSGSTFQNGFELPGSISDENSFKSDIGGTLPTGLQYDFSGNVNQQYGMVNPGGHQRLAL